MSEEKKVVTEENITGLDLLGHWVQIAYLAFKNQADTAIKDESLSQEKKDVLLARAAISMNAINKFIEDGLPKIRTALDLLDTHHDLDLMKVKEGTLTVTEEELKAWADDQNFCQVMLRGKKQK